MDTLYLSGTDLKLRKIISNRKLNLELNRFIMDGLLVKCDIFNSKRHYNISNIQTNNLIHD